MRGRTLERVAWLLRRIVRGRLGWIVAWDEETVDDFVGAFPEAEKTLRVYIYGPNSSPMLNDAAKRAKVAGYITPGTIGNEDARWAGHRTWSRTWTITTAGRHFLDTLPRSQLS